jgi:hypothetical protein
MRVAPPALARSQNEVAVGSIGLRHSRVLAAGGAWRPLPPRPYDPAVAWATAPGPRATLPAPQPPSRLSAAGGRGSAWLAPRRPDAAEAAAAALGANRSRAERGSHGVPGLPAGSRSHRCAGRARGRQHEVGYLLCLNVGPRALPRLILAVSCSAPATSSCCCPPCAPELWPETCPSSERLLTGGGTSPSFRRRLPMHSRWCAPSITSLASVPVNRVDRLPGLHTATNFKLNGRRVPGWTIGNPGQVSAIQYGFTIAGGPTRPAKRSSSRHESTRSLRGTCRLGNTDTVPVTAYRRYQSEFFQMHEHHRECGTLWHTLNACAARCENDVSDEAFALLSTSLPSDSRAEWGPVTLASSLR